GGNAAAQFNNRTTTTNWNSTTAGAGNGATCSFSTAVTVPTAGRIFRWSYPEVAGTTYDWSPATYLSGTTGNTVTASGVAETTTYTVVATVPGGCPQTAQVTVTVNDPISAGTISPVPASFCTGGSVTLTANPTNGVAPYTYAWTGPGGPAGTAQTQVVNTPGLWSCLITDACSGSVTVNTTVTSTTPPAVSINATAPICVGGSVTLSANVISGSVTGYLWGGAAPVGGQTGSSVTINGLTAANNGNYTLTAFDGGCASTVANYNLVVNPNPTISSTTATPNPVCEGSNSVLNVNASLPTSAYCAATTSSPCDESIGNVTFNTINNTSGCGSYSDFTAISTTVSVGTPYPITVTNGGNPYTDNLVSVWIDWNRNGIFEANEQTDLTNVGGTGSLFTGSITPPVNAFNGSTRMRVRMLYFTAPVACDATNYGEAEDYTVVITGGVTQLSYLWTGGTFLGGVNNTPNVTATSITSATPYSVQVLSGTGCTSTGNVTVNVNPLPAVPDCGGPYATLCVAGPSFQLTPGTPGGVWSGTGVTPGGLFDPAVGTQLLTYTVTESGCSNSCTVTVNVNSADTDGDNIPDCVDECPLIPGEIGDACDAGPGFILGEIDANCNCIGVPCTEDVRMQVRTDNNGSHTTFQIRESVSNLLVCSGGPFTGINNATISEDCCLPEGCFNLLVFDSFGDGILGGGYNLFEITGTQRRIIDNWYDAFGAGGFTSGSLSQINDNPGFCVPLGTDRLVVTSCDKRDWKLSPCGG
ncbi:MAG TPA: GEVED domain-containing protein, partial [Flavobacteriales bacterium]|nr:GEVED domain-containing protein [Flavobacteriales bacterium]